MKFKLHPCGHRQTLSGYKTRDVLTLACRTQPVPSTNRFAYENEREGASWKTAIVPVVAGPPYYGTRRYLLRAMRPKLSWLRLIPGRQVAEDTEGPTVMPVAGDGREVVVQRPGTFGQARRAASGLDRELAQLGLTEFCRRYGINLPSDQS
jgi:hypothetical protein